MHLITHLDKLVGLANSSFMKRSYVHDNCFTGISTEVGFLAARCRGGYRIYVDGCTLKSNYVVRKRSDKIFRDYLCALSMVSYVFP